jgi:hypothetical protein
LTKLLRLDYTIEYKKRVDNKIVDALSRRDGHSTPSLSPLTELHSLSELIPQWIIDIKLSYTYDHWIQELL